MKTVTTPAPALASDAVAHLTVFFDGSCPLCRREIAFYQRLHTPMNLRWVDVSTPAELPAGLDCRAAMQRFHVQSTDGQVTSGARAFSLLWQCFWGWRVLRRLTAIPPVTWVAEGAYRLFLRFRPQMQAWFRR